MAIAAPNSDLVILRGSDRDGGQGINPSVCIHPEGSVAAMTYLRNDTLYYKVGKVIKKTMKIKWGEERSHHEGSHPSIALIHQENNYVVVTTYSGLSSSICYYRVGIINIQALSIDWGGSHELNRGLILKVCANDNRTVVVIKEEAGAKIHYRIGTVNINHKTIDWNEEFNRLNQIERGVQTAVAMNKDIVTVVYCKDSYLYAIIGALEAERIDWGNSLPSHGENSMNPSVSINAHGFIIEVHQSKRFRRMLHSVGVANRDHHRIKWNESNLRCGLGKNPAISVSNNGLVLEAHETNSYGPNDSIYYSLGMLIKPHADIFHREIPPAGFPPVEFPPADGPPAENPPDNPGVPPPEIPPDGLADNPPQDLDVPPQDPDIPPPPGNPADAPPDPAPPDDPADNPEHIPPGDIGEEEHQEADNEE